MDKKHGQILPNANMFHQKCIESTILQWLFKELPQKTGSPFHHTGCGALWNVPPDARRAGLTPRPPCLKKEIYEKETCTRK